MSLSALVMRKEEFNFTKYRLKLLGVLVLFLYGLI